MLDLLRRLGQVDMAKGEQAHQSAQGLGPADRGDHDLDGVPDETEAWLGTSSLTDHSNPGGRDDAGFVVDQDRMDRSQSRFVPVGKMDRRYNVPAPPC